MFCYALNIQPGLTHTFLLYFKPVTGNLNTYKLMLHAFFFEQHFYKQSQDEIGRKSRKWYQHPEAEL